MMKNNYNETIRTQNNIIRLLRNQSYVVLLLSIASRSSDCSFSVETGFIAANDYNVYLLDGDLYVLWLVSSLVLKIAHG